MISIGFRRNDRLPTHIINFSRLHVVVFFSGMIATFSNVELVLDSVKIRHLKWMEEPVHILIPGHVMQITG